MDVLETCRHSVGKYCGRRVAAKQIQPRQFYSMHVVYKFVTTAGQSSEAASMADCRRPPGCLQPRSLGSNTCRSMLLRSAEKILSTEYQEHDHRDRHD